MARRMLLGCGLALASAVLATSSFAPFGAWPLIFVAFVPLLVAQYRVLPARWSALAPALGYGGFFAGMFGGVFPPAAAWYMKALPLLVAVGVVVTSLRERSRRDRSGYRSMPALVATSWVAVELVRLFVPVLGSWGFLGYALHRQAWLIQPVRSVGIFGLDLLIMVVNAAIALLVIAELDRRATFEAPTVVSRRAGLAWCALAAGFLGAWIAASLSSLDAPGSTVRVAALQPGIKRRGLSPEERNRRLLEKLTEQTREAAARGAKLVVWPEATLTVDPTVAHRSELSTLARETGATLVLGYVVFEPHGTRNEAITIEPSGQFVGLFGKDHPVTFLGGTSLTRGRYPTVETSFGTIATAICADLDFTDTVRKLARRGARLIAVPSADWPAIAAKHYTLAVFRALESGAAIVKSEFSFDSIIVDASGRILASEISPEGSAAVLVADVPLRTGALPLAARWADWAGWFSLGARVGLALCELLRGRRVKAPALAAVASVAPAQTMSPRRAS
ncbi:MAG TPA: apolipoprotein N-acyltransferase [Polyangia bacterium]|nr:apolipoprotein N-acyltransferase [Polyangia bacterium]